MKRNVRNYSGKRCNLYVSSFQDHQCFINEPRLCIYIYVYVYSRVAERYLMTRGERRLLEGQGRIPCMWLDRDIELHRGEKIGGRRPICLNPSAKWNSRTRKRDPDSFLMGIRVIDSPHFFSLILFLFSLFLFSFFFFFFFFFSTSTTSVTSIWGMTGQRAPGSVLTSG